MIFPPLPSSSQSKKQRIDNQSFIGIWIFPKIPGIPKREDLGRIKKAQSTVGQLFIQQSSHYSHYAQFFR
jgi:hypothetical protein